MWAAFLLSFGVIFIAELGDKSQLLALAFATRHPVIPVLIGMTVSTALLVLVSVLVGAALGAAIPTTALTVASAVAFTAFGFWTLRSDDSGEDGEDRAARPTHHVILAVAGAIFLAEFGDKTMLATVTLASRNGPFGTWLGATLGMLAADVLAVLIGRQIGARLPERTVRIGASILFFAFAVALGVEAIR